MAREVIDNVSTVRFGRKGPVSGKSAVHRFCHQYAVVNIWKRSIPLEMEVAMLWRLEKGSQYKNGESTRFGERAGIGGLTCAPSHQTSIVAIFLSIT
jgi:hypothetical protein